MRRIAHSRLQSVLTMCCIAAFLFSYVNSTMFWHGHTVSGNWLLHSHLASKEHRSAPASNPHTDAQLILIQALNESSCTEDAVASYDLEPLRPLVAVQATEPQSSPSLCAASRIALRGPPALV